MWPGQWGWEPNSVKAGTYDVCYVLTTLLTKVKPVESKPLPGCFQIWSKRSQDSQIILIAKLLQETDKILRLLIRIRSVNRSKGVKLRFEYDHIAPSGFGVADQEGTDSYVLFGSNMTYVWTGSPLMIMARFKYDHKSYQRESRIQIWSTPYWLF